MTHEFEGNAQPSQSRYGMAHARVLTAALAMLGLGLLAEPIEIKQDVGLLAPIIASAHAQKAAPAAVTEADLMKPGPLPDNVMGSPDAKVTILEYASLTCGHCASFHKQVFPDIKKKYIDTKKAKYILREFPLDDRAAAAFMLARCAGTDKYYPMVDVLFERQEQWAFVKGSPVDELKKIGRQIGMTEETFNGCLKDQKLLDGIVAIREQGSKFGVSSTPSFFINGQPLKGGVGLAEFDKVIEPLLK